MDADLRKGDQPGYFLSAEFWADRYRDSAAGRYTQKAPRVPQRENKLSKSDS